MSAADWQFLAAWSGCCLVLAIAYGPGAVRDIEARIFGGRRRNRRAGRLGRFLSVSESFRGWRL